LIILLAFPAKIGGRLCYGNERHKFLPQGDEGRVLDLLQVWSMSLGVELPNVFLPE
jgi:hypothetical protein